MTDDLDAIAKRAYEGLDDLWIEDRVERFIAPKIAEWCQGRVLDMGYGTGVMARALRDAGVKLTVVEGSAELYGDALAEGFPAVESLFEEFDPLPKPDTVLALYVLEHVEDPVGLLQRVHSWLRPGGRLIVATPNASSIHRRVGAEMTGLALDTPSERDLAVGHRRVYTLQRLCRDLAAAGFPTGHRFGWFAKPVPNAMMLSWPPEMIDALCQIGWDGDAHDAANIGVVLTKV